LATGKTSWFNCWRRAIRAIGNTPLTDRRLPSRESSPANRQSCSRSAGQCPIAASNATAIGKSKPAPTFLSCAGARLTTIFLGGRANPQLLNAARIRSRLSRIVLSGRPTILKALSPIATSTSTVIGWASITKNRGGVCLGYHDSLKKRWLDESIGLLRRKQTVFVFIFVKQCLL